MNVGLTDQIAASPFLAVLGSWGGGVINDELMCCTEVIHPSVERGKPNERAAWEGCDEAEGETHFFSRNCCWFHLSSFLSWVVPFNPCCMRKCIQRKGVGHPGDLGSHQILTPSFLPLKIIPALLDLQPEALRAPDSTSLCCSEEMRPYKEMAASSRTSTERRDWGWEGPGQGRRAPELRTAPSLPSPLRYHCPWSTQLPGRFSPWVFLRRAESEFRLLNLELERQI